MPPDPPISSALRASLLPLRANYIPHSIQIKNLGIYAEVYAVTRVAIGFRAGHHHDQNECG